MTKYVVGESYNEGNKVDSKGLGGWEMNILDFSDEYLSTLSKNELIHFRKQLYTVLSELKEFFGEHAYKQLCLTIEEKFQNVNEKSMVVLSNFIKWESAGETDRMKWARKIVKEIDEWQERVDEVGGCRIFILCVCLGEEDKAEEMIKVLESAMKLVFWVNTCGWLGEPEILCFITTGEERRETGYKILTLGQKW